MMRSPFTGAFSVLLSIVLVLLIGGLIATDRTLMNAAERQARIDAEQTRIAVRQAMAEAIRSGGSPADIARDSGVRAAIEAGPAERDAAALIAGGDTILVSGLRSAFPRDLTFSVPVPTPWPVPWTLVVAHAPAVATYRLGLWTLGLITIGLLAFGVIRERRQAIRVGARSAELERLYSEVARANTAKSEFLANISHELRTPLNAIVGFVELLKDGVYGNLSPRQAQPVDRIAASANHLRQLVDQVLDIAKIAAGRLEVHTETIVLRSFVLNVANELESLVSERGLTLTVAVAASLPRVRTDPTHLRQILVNLIGNAVKYTREGGVSVRAKLIGAHYNPSAPHRLTPEDPILAQRSPDPQRPWIALQVVDTGVGIAPADQARIFEEFEQVNAGPRADSVLRGTGLGLAISKRLANLLEGSIGVESQLGKGSTFTVWLPVHPADLEPAGTPTPTSVERAI